MACGSSGKDQRCRHYSRRFEETWALGLRLRNLAAHGHCFIRLMDKILHDPKDPKLWELWYTPYNG